MRLRNPFELLLPNLYELREYLRLHRRAYVVGYIYVVATSAFSLAQPWVLRAAVNRLERAGLGGMLRYALWLVGLAALSAIFLYLMRKKLIGVSRRIEYQMRGDFFAHLQTLSLSFFHRQQTGDLMARASNDLNAVRDCLGPGIMYGMNTVTVVLASSVLMLRLDPVLTICTVIPLPILAYLVRHFSGEMYRRNRAVQDQYGVLSSALQENLAGIRVVQSYVQGPFEEAHFDGLSRRYMKLGFRLIRYRSLFAAMMGSLVGFLMLVLLWVGGLRVIQGAIGLGEFIAFMAYLGMLAWPFIALGWILAMVQRGEAAMARILEIRRQTPEIRDAVALLPARPLRGAIEFRALHFRYAPESPEVLAGLDEKIPAGTTVAIVGRTGSGKSTLVSLIPRLYDPTAGEILLDGVDARNRSLQEIRAAIAVVPQESFLFSDTLRANILFGRPEASEEELQCVVRRACLERDLADFPHGLDTLVGERGITLSGGQRQRVALARALLANPRILILDDAFSSVDKITEAELLESLRGNRGDCTTILIAHRISTVREADRILLLKDGAIAESGTHEELVTLGGLYAAMERRQRLAEEIEDAAIA